MIFKIGDRVFNQTYGTGLIIKIDSDFSFNPYFVQFDAENMKCWCKEENLEFAINPMISYKIGTYSKKVIEANVEKCKEIQELLHNHFICRNCDLPNQIMSPCRDCALHYDIKYIPKE